MKIFISADHKGFHLKNSLMQYLDRAGYDVQDDGRTTLDPEDDFPVSAQFVAQSMLAHGVEDARGILVCGSGQGVCMAANRFKGIRAALGYSRETVKAARNDSNANVLCLSADDMDKSQANVIVETFLNTPFEGATRFRRRIQAIDEF